MSTPPITKDQVIIAIIKERVAILEAAILERVQSEEVQLLTVGHCYRCGTTWGGTARHHVDGCNTEKLARVLPNYPWHLQ